MKQKEQVELGDHCEKKCKMSATKLADMCEEEILSQSLDICIQQPPQIENYFLLLADFVYLIILNF